MSALRSLSVHSPARNRPRLLAVRRRSFLSKTLADFSQAMESAFFAEEIARRPGLLQSLDPRGKLLACGALLLAVGLARHPSTLLGLYLLTLVVAFVSGVPGGIFLRRVAVIVPLFTGLVALPAVFLTPGREVLNLALPATFPGPLPGLVVTEQGLRTALMLVLRATASVSLATLLVLTTPWSALLKGLRVLRVPVAFVLILMTTHRYLFLLLHTANAMVLARQSRSVGPLSGAENRRWVARALGVLLARSYHLSEEVYLAMLARGFRGEARLLDQFRWTARDWWAGAAVLLVAAGMLAQEI